MKFTPLFRHAFILLVLALLTSSCNKGTQPVSKHTVAWLQTESDATFSYTSNTGDKEALTVTFREDTRTRSSGKFTGDRTYQNYLLTYTGLQSDLGLVLLAEENTLYIRNSGQTAFNTNYAYLLTGKYPADENVLRYDVETELLSDLALNGVTYERVLRVKFFLPNRPDKIQEIYYAKHHGLVAFVTTDGKTWRLD